MRALTSTELSRMRTAQSDGMMDGCTILRRIEGGVDEYGMPITAWVEGPTTACGYDGRRHVEAGAPAGTQATQIGLTDGRLRLPIETAIENSDRIELTHRFGDLLDHPIVYELIGEPRRGPSGLVVEVRRVTNG